MNWGGGKPHNYHCQVPALSKTARDQKLQDWIDQLENPLYEELSPQNAALELGHAAKSVGVRKEINQKLREQPHRIIQLENLTQAQEPYAARAAIYAIHSLLCPEEPTGLYVCANFLLVDKLVDERLVYPSIQAMKGLILSMARDHLWVPSKDEAPGLGERTPGLEAQTQCAAVLRFFMCATPDVFMQMSEEIAATLFGEGLPRMLRSKARSVPLPEFRDKVVFLEALQAAHWLTEHNARTLESVVLGLSTDVFVDFMEGLVEGMKNWKAEDSGVDLVHLFELMICLARMPKGRSRMLWDSAAKAVADPNMLDQAKATAGMLQSPPEHSTAQQPQLSQIAGSASQQALLLGQRPMVSVRHDSSGHQLRMHSLHLEFRFHTSVLNFMLNLTECLNMPSHS
ncbi:hypothetical protein CYMTET_8338, partial [Cymbomonas tetramitiformis]